MVLLHTNVLNNNVQYQYIGAGVVQCSQMTHVPLTCKYEYLTAWPAALRAWQL